jgi:hypothetical protein
MTPPFHGGAFRRVSRSTQGMGTLRRSLGVLLAGVTLASGALLATSLAACGGDPGSPSDGGARPDRDVDSGDDAGDASAEAGAGDATLDATVDPPDSNYEEPNSDEMFGDALIDGECDGLDDDSDGAIDELACPCTARTWRGHAYLFCNTSAVQWAAARALCKAVGPYDLAAVNSEAENTWLAGYALPQAAERGWWIGFSRPALNGSYAWATADPVTFTRWAPGQPNNNMVAIGILDVERCAEFGYYKGASARGFWNDAPCLGSFGADAVQRPWVCESVDPE